MTSKTKFGQQTIQVYRKRGGSILYDEHGIPGMKPPIAWGVVGGAHRTWRAAGEGNLTPLVLLHGIGSNARSWVGQLAGLAEGRRVVAWNAPGYAGSAPLEADWPTARDYASALAALLDYLGIDRCVMVGQSLGAIMAAAFVAEWPARVAALMLVSPATGYGADANAPLPAPVATRIDELAALGPAGFADRRAGRLLTDAAGATARRLVRDCMAEVEPGGYRQASRMLATADIRRDGRRLAVPTLVAWGQADVITPPESCRAVAAAIPGARSAELPGLGHGFATEAPAIFNALLRPLLEACPGPSTALDPVSHTLKRFAVMDSLADQPTARSWDRPAGASLQDWMLTRVARVADRPYDWNALKFQADFDPKYRRAQKRFIGTGATGVGSDSNTIPAEHFTLSNMILPPGAEGPLHLHTDAEEVFFVLRGKVKVIVEAGGERWESILGERDCISVPPGVYRGEENIGEEEAIIMVMIGSPKPITPTYPAEHPLAKVKRS